MHQWERRLRDLSTILVSCEAAYFDPEIFRINTNQFLQTSRTVTFIIQKNKESIPGFDAWYKQQVRDPWSKDPRMAWAKDSRNKIEKEGDLELHSSMGVRLIFSYRSEEDIVLPCGRGELLWNVKRLARFARKQLPTGISDVAVVQIDRRWVANSLPDLELLHALTYVYARLRDVCVSLSQHLGSQLSADIPDATTFDQLLSDARKTRYLLLNSNDLSRYGARRVMKDPNFKLHPGMVSAISEIAASKPKDLEESAKWYARMAKTTFEHCGNHVPMLFMLNESCDVVDYVSTAFESQASKYLFWRLTADRVLYLKPWAVIWICESWLRDVKGYPYTPVRNLPIICEFLSVVALDHDGNSITIRWNIHRDDPGSPPTLKHERVLRGAEADTDYYFIPIREAFQRLRAGSTG